MGTCRKTDLFVTNSSFELVNINNLKQQYDENTSWAIQSRVNQLNDEFYGVIPKEQADIIQFEKKNKDKGLFDI